jgi:hypothetical protein
VSEPNDPPPTPVLGYGVPTPNQRIMRLGFLSLVLALLGFPIGTGISILLETARNVPHRIGDRAGFTVFAIFEGLATAVGFLAWRRMESPSRFYRIVIYFGMAAGMVGVAIVAWLYIDGAVAP